MDIRTGRAWVIGALMLATGLLLGSAGGPAYAACTSKPLPMTHELSEETGPKWLRDCYVPAKELLEPEAYAAYLEDALKGACYNADRRLFAAFRARYPQLPFAEKLSDRQSQWGWVVGYNYQALEFCRAKRRLERAESDIRINKIRAPHVRLWNGGDRDYREGRMPEPVYERNSRLKNILWLARHDFGPAQLVVARYALTGVLPVVHGATYHFLLRARRGGTEAPDLEKLLARAKAELEPELRTFVEANIETLPLDMYIELRLFDRSKR